jgi:hypothetical protein
MLPIRESQHAVETALGAPAIGALAAALEGAGLTAECDRLVSTVTPVNGLQARLASIRAAIAPAAPPGAFERLLLLRQAGRALSRLPSLPVSDDVKRLFCEQIRYIAEPPAKASFDVGRAGFVASSELVTLRRYPAGQYDWQVSGLPRSWVLRVQGRARLTLLYWIARRMKGFGPVFFPHLNPYRRNRWLTENEANRAYYRMAESLRLQPEIKGLVASSWLRSPDTFKASPHLAWMNRTIEDNGGLAVVMGVADPESGALARSAARQRLYEKGEFVPTTGLVLWPRDAMLAWADRVRADRNDPRGTEISARPRTLSASAAAASTPSL